MIPRNIVELKQTDGFGSGSFSTMTVSRDNLVVLRGSVLVAITKIAIGMTSLKECNRKQCTGTGAIKRQIPLLKPKREINKYTPRQKFSIIVFQKGSRNVW